MRNLSHRAASIARNMAAALNDFATNHGKRSLSIPINDPLDLMFLVEDLRGDLDRLEKIAGQLADEMEDQP